MTTIGVVRCQRVKQIQVYNKMEYLYQIHRQMCNLQHFDTYPRYKNEIMKNSNFQCYTKSISFHAIN